MKTDAEIQVEIDRLTKMIVGRQAYDTAAIHRLNDLRTQVDTLMWVLGKDPVEWG